jgi:hypothetical protein
VIAIFRVGESGRYPTTLIHDHRMVPLFVDIVVPYQVPDLHARKMAAIMFVRSFENLIPVWPSP